MVVQNPGFVIPYLLLTLCLIIDGMASFISINLEYYMEALTHADYRVWLHLNHFLMPRGIKIHLNGACSADDGNQTWVTSSAATE